MNPLLIKSLIAAGGIGLGGVGIWQINEHMKPRTIQERLEGEGVTFPPLDDDAALSEWKKLSDSNSSAGDNKVSVEGESAITGNNAEEKKMRSACGKLMGKSLSDTNEQEIKKVRDRCAKQAS